MDLSPHRVGHHYAASVPNGKNRDGSDIDTNQYAALLLAVLVPPVGLGYGLYLRNRQIWYATRVIVASLIAVLFWVGLALLS
jgi:hypothetical protein